MRPTHLPRRNIMRKQLKILAVLLTLVGAGFVAKQILARKAS